MEPHKPAVILTFKEHLQAGYMNLYWYSLESRKKEMVICCCSVLRMLSKLCSKGGTGPETTKIEHIFELS